MRFKITLAPDPGRGGRVLPINYQYELSSFIYHTLNVGNQNLATWLHDKGYVKENKAFKLFTFSNLHLPKFNRYEDRLILLSPEVFFVLSFLPLELSETFVIGLFREKDFSLGDKKSKVHFQVKSIERLPDPEFTGSMHFKALSPLVVTTRRDESDRYATYLSPTDEGYAENLRKNLINKYAAFLAHAGKKPVSFNGDGFALEPIGKPRSKLVHVKANTPAAVKIKAYSCDFALSGPPELLKIGYYAGFGEKNSLGFGCGAIK